MLLTKKIFAQPGPNGSWLRWRVASIIFVGIMAGFLIGSSGFLYTNVFRTLEDANTILLLNPTLGIDILNSELYSRAEAAMALKTNPITIPAPLRNIFSFASSSPHDTTTPQF